MPVRFAGQPDAGLQLLNCWATLQSDGLLARGLTDTRPSVLTRIKVTPITCSPS